MYVGLAELVGSKNMLCKIFRLRNNLASLLPVNARNAQKNFSPGRTIVGSYRRRICPAIKRLQIGGQKYIQWPTSAPCHCLNGIHINMVKIWTFFPVNFDVDKVFVHNCSRGLIFKTFLFHYMAPMTSRIPHTHQNRFILGSCFFNGLFSPWIPVHWIVCVL